MALDPDRLTSIDDFGDRIKIIPAEVKGFYRRQRSRLQFLLLLIFLGLPWTKINGQQTLLLDIPGRKFAIFGMTFWAHDAPLVFFILGTVTIGLAFVTSIWGRVWCGWACPQTVFIDAVFRRIEILVQGKYIERRRLAQASLSFEKAWKFSLTWILFFIVSSLIAHSFIAYFVGADRLLQMIEGSPSENWSYFVLITSMTLAVLFDFGWFREQFCIIMCPYGRFQSVLMDQKSLAVVYDTQRGEPRKGLQKNAPAGDCVSCNRCVQVCPTGIDIRKGVQMECIACTACMDACDEIMQKVKKPQGLIRYETLDRSKVNLLKPRSLVYMVLVLFFVGGLIFNIVTREKAQIFLMRGQEAPYTLLQNERGEPQILNHFKLQIQNQNFAQARYLLTAAPEWEAQGITLVVAQNPVDAKSGEMITVHFFVRFKPDVLSAQGQFKTQLLILDQANPEKGLKAHKELILLGPAHGT